MSLTKQYYFATSANWERTGNRRSGVALAMRHRHRGLSTYRLNGLRQGDEHWAPRLCSTGTWYTLAFICHPAFSIVPGSRAGSGVETISPIRFTAGCHKKRLNQAPFVLWLIVFFWTCFVLFTVATFIVFGYFTSSPVCLLVFLFRLVAAVQVIGWKKSPTYNQGWKKHSF